MLRQHDAVAGLDAYQEALDPPESRHALDLSSLKQPKVLFAVARGAPFGGCWGDPLSVCKQKQLGK